MIIFISSQCINKQYQDWACKKQRLFPIIMTWQWSVNMIKLLWCRFQQCLCTFTMLLVTWSSETRLFRRLSDHVFKVRDSRNTKSMRVIFFFSKYLTFIAHFKYGVKNSEKFFFSDIIGFGLVSLNCVS